MKNLRTIDIEKLEDIPNRSKIRNGLSYRYRNGNIPYGRIWRFLNSKVGSSWDKIFSEFKILSWMPFEHRIEKVLASYVDRNTILKKDGVYFLDEAYGDYRPVSECSIIYKYGCHSFYLHPKTKILCRREKIKRKIELDESFKVLGDYHQLIKIKGIWHEVKGKLVDTGYIEHNGLTYKYMENYVPPMRVESAQFEDAIKSVYPKNHFEDFSKVIFINGKPASPCWNSRFVKKQRNPKECLIKNDTNNYSYRNYVYDKEVKIIIHRQLSSKELKKHGLKNDMIDLLQKPCPICGSFDKENYHCLGHVDKVKRMAWVSTWKLNR